MIRLMSIPPILAAGGFVGAELTAGNWREFETLTDAQRSTLRDRHGTWIRIHPSDGAELEKYGLDFQRDAEGRPNRQAPLVDPYRHRRETGPKGTPKPGDLDPALLEEGFRALRDQGAQLEEHVRLLESERRKLDEERKIFEEERARFAQQTSKAPEPSKTGQGRETTVVDPSEASPDGRVESDSKTTTNTKTATPESDAAKSTKKGR